MIVRYLAAVDGRNGHDQTHHCPQADFRYGSQPDLPPLDRDVRFAALNGLKSDIAPCPKSADFVAKVS